MRSAALIVRHDGDAGKPVIGYVRVSTDEQGDSGLGLEVQRAAITSECQRRGWNLLRTYEDIASGKSVNGRHGLKEALATLDSGGADALVVAKLDRLSRSLQDFVELAKRAQKKGWALTLLDVSIDMTTPQGEMMANTLANFAQFERRIIGERTRKALAIKRAQGTVLGRPPVLDTGLVKRIVGMAKRKKTLSAIANTLNEERVPTAHGGERWYATTVRKILLREQRVGGVAPRTSPPTTNKQVRRGRD